jgi:hypothetical protein
MMCSFYGIRPHPRVWGAALQCMKVGNRLAERTLTDRVAALGHVAAYVDRMPELLRAGATQLDATSSLGILVPGAALLHVAPLLAMLPFMWRPCSGDLPHQHLRVACASQCSCKHTHVTSTFPLMQIRGMGWESSYCRWYYSHLNVCRSGHSSSGCAVQPAQVSCVFRS